MTDLDLSLIRRRNGQRRVDAGCYAGTYAGDSMRAACDDVDALLAEVELLRQTSGDLCERCGWRGVRPPDACAFCEADFKRRDAGQFKEG